MEHAKKKDAKAARMLLDCLVENIDRFLNFCSENPKLAREIRFPNEPWPLLHTQLAVNPEGYLTIPKNHLLRTLGVVRAGRSLDEQAIGTRVAKQLYRQMDFYRRTLRQQLWDSNEKHLEEAIDLIRRLEPLSPSNYSAWWKAAERLFVLQWGKEFQDDPDFAAWNEKNYMGMLASQIPGRKRGDIKRAIRQGFRSLANELWIDHPD